MSFRSYTRLFFTLLGLMLALLVTTAIAAYLTPYGSVGPKSKFAVASMVCGASAFAVNAACGIKHRKVWARGGLAQEGDPTDPGWFGYYIWSNVIIAALCLLVAVRVWSGAIPVFSR